MSAPEPASATQGIEPWWGPHEVPLGLSRRWRIGPLTLVIERRRGEWRLGTSRSDDIMDAAVDIEPAKQDAAALDGLDVQRLAFAGSDEVLSFRPRLTELPVVNRPETPLMLPSGELATLYLGSPVVLALLAADWVLTELPLALPSRTWFGSPEEGQLALASRTFCRMNLDELRHRPHRATTAVTIRNTGTDELALRRILLPVQHLSLSLGEDRNLWTEEVHLTRNDDDQLAQLDLRSKQWKEAHPSASVLAPPRVPETTSPLIRVFSPLFPS